MKLAFFYHSLLSDWNHGNAHFLRGIGAELQSRGHHVRIFEPVNGWSLKHLQREHGQAPVHAFYQAYPGLRSESYDPATIDLDDALDGVDLALVHEWNDQDFVARIGRHRKTRNSYRLLFHDTHHRAVTAPDEMAAYDLSNYDGVLAFGGALADVYSSRRWARRVWVWHEAADTRVFAPRPNAANEGDLIWIGNWGDEERTAELREFLLEPVKALGLKARVHGVRYPQAALNALSTAGIEVRGWLPNFHVPDALSRFRVTVHIPRRPYIEALPGIPTIRPFEALACGIPLVCSPWNDSERLFSAGKDYLVAEDGAQMKRHLGRLLADPGLARALRNHGRRTILQRHTCAHRVDELLAVYRSLSSAQRSPALTAAPPEPCL